MPDNFYVDIEAGNGPMINFAPLDYIQFIRGQEYKVVVGGKEVWSVDAKPYVQPDPGFKFEETVLRSYPTGSRYICNPPPKDTDNDTMILVNGFFDYRSALLFEGWTVRQSTEYNQRGNFEAFRKGEENYIVTEDPEFFASYVKATEGAKALNLLNKEDRIKLFQAVADAPREGYKGLRQINRFFHGRPVFNAEVQF